MDITIRRSEASDRAAIIALMSAARGDGLPAEERARRGYVQGTLDEGLLARVEQGPGLQVAVADGTVVGFAMASVPDPYAEGARGALARVMAERHPEDRLVMYGPIAVDPAAQGQGLVKRLLVAVARSLQGRYDLAIAFVELANAKSLGVHRHLPLDEEEGFLVGDRAYAAFSFNPERLLAALAAQDA